MYRMKRRERRQDLNQERQCHDNKGGFKAGEKGGVVDGVESHTEVKQDQNVDVVGISEEEKVSCHFEQRCFSTVFGPETKLELLFEVIV